MNPKPRQKVQVWIWATDPARPRRAPQVLIFKTRPGRGEFWQPVTGSVEPGEELDAAAWREAAEETGLSFKLGKTTELRKLGKPFRFEKRGTAFEEQGFALRIQSLRSGRPPKVTLDPNEHTDYEWTSPTQARRKIAYASNRRLLDLLCRQWSIQSPRGERNTKKWCQIRLKKKSSASEKVSTRSSTRLKARSSASSKRKKPPRR